MGDMIDTATKITRKYRMMFRQFICTVPSDQEGLFYWILPYPSIDGLKHENVKFVPEIKDIYPKMLISRDQIIRTVNHELLEKGTSFRFQVARLVSSCRSCPCLEKLEPKEKLLLSIGVQSRMVGFIEEMVALSQAKAGQTLSFMENIKPYDLLMRIAAERGVFHKFQLIYPASGIDIIPARYAKTLMIDRQHISKELDYMWGKDEPGKNNATLATFDARHVEQYPIDGRIMLLFKGVSTFLSILHSPFMLGTETMSDYIMRLNSIMKPGDRILILDNEDLENSLPALKENNYREIDNWIDEGLKSRILFALRNMTKKGHLIPSITGPLSGGCVFVLPSTFALFEKA